MTTYLRRYSPTSILYVLILSFPDDINFITIPSELNNIPFLLRQVPKDLMQFSHPIEFTTKNIILNHQVPLHLLTLPIDQADEAGVLINSYLKLYQIRRNIIVFLVDAKSKILTSILEMVKNFNLAFWYIHIYNNKQNFSYEWPLNNSFDTSIELINLIQIKLQLVKADLNERTNYYHNLTLEYNQLVDEKFCINNKFIYFTPCHSNFFTLNQICLNYWSNTDYHIKTQEDANKDRSKAIKFFKENDPKNRMNFILDGVKLIDNMVQKIFNQQNNSNLEPIILISPFHNPNLKRLLKLEKKEKGKEFILLQYLNAEQDKNYLFEIELPDIINNDAQSKIDATRYFSHINQDRMQFLDCIGYLHSSFTLSPIIRFPLKGKSINKELGYFKPENNFFGSDHRKNTPIRAIHKFGTKLNTLLLNQKIKEYIKNRNGQVVAISDLPLEWLTIESIPLNFTHDICRIPETNYRSLFNTYLLNSKIQYIIPKNILSRTLVISGASYQQGKDEAFKKWHSIVEELSSNIGFTFKHCSSIEDVINAIEDIKPDLLIFDCHGIYEKRTVSSYLNINGQRLSTEDIVKHEIGARMVFLSACYTMPNYGKTDLLCDAFFQTGAISVTATFLPVSVDHGTILYTRLLRLLNEALQKPIHKNWLSFICYVVRTSIIHEALTFPMREKEELEDKDIQHIAEYLLKCQNFNGRRKVYEAFKNKKSNMEMLTNTLI